jgi:hypothetical protein
MVAYEGFLGHAEVGGRCVGASGGFAVMAVSGEK